MNKNHDLDKIGKRLPYRTPNDFFPNMEDNIWAEIKGDYVKPTATPDNDTENLVTLKSHRLLPFKRIAAVAAAIALIFIINAKFMRQSCPTIHDVDQAFSQLSVEDQAYMLNIYQADIYLNE